MNINWGGLDWVAIYGAVLASILALWELSKNRRRLTVTSTKTFPTDKHDALSSIFKHYPPRFSLRAVNGGHRSVEIIGAKFLLNNGESLELPRERDETNPFPATVGDGEGIFINFALEDVAEHIASYQRLTESSNIFITKIYMLDSTDKKYYARIPGEFRDAGIAKPRIWPVRQWQKLMRKK